MDPQVGRSNIESVKTIAESASVLVVVRVFQLVGIPLILAFVIFLTGSIYSNTIQVTQMTVQMAGLREIMDQRTSWIERRLDTLEKKVDDFQSKRP